MAHLKKKKKKNVLYKIGLWLVLNYGPPVLKATAVPQTLPFLTYHT